MTTEEIEKIAEDTETNTITVNNIISSINDSIKKKSEMYTSNSSTWTNTTSGTNLNGTYGGTYQIGGYDPSIWQGVQQTTQLTASDYYYNFGKPEIVEVELIDGRRTILKISFDKIRHIYEFEDDETERHVEFELNENGVYNKYSVKCSLSAFMNLIGVEYKAWAASMLDNMVKNGE